MMIGVLEKDNSFDLNVPEEPTEEEEQKELKEEKGLEKESKIINFITAVKIAR